MLAVLAVVLATAMVAGGDEAAAHAAFDRSDPTPNAILPESPESIQIWFTEPLEFDYSGAELYDDQGALISDAVSEPGEGEYSLLIRLSSSLDRGTYSVVWNNLSAADGHTARGYFAFTIGTSADVTEVAAPVAGGNDQPPLWLQTVSRWAVYLAQAPLIAGWIIWLLVLFPATRDDSELRGRLAARLWRLSVGALVLTLAANLLALAVQAEMIGRGSLLENIWDVLSDTRYGQLWIWRIALLAAVGVVLEWVDWLEPLRRRWLTALALVLSLALPVPISLNAHASALTEGRTTAIVFDWVHLSGASIWFGGLLILLLLLFRTLGTETSRRDVLAAALPRFSAVALVCWGLLALTGAYATWLQVGSLDALRTTDFGKTLMAKLALVVVVLIIAAVNLLVITRKLLTDAAGKWSKRLTWAVTSEVVLTILILMLVGRMTSLQPARDAVAQPAAGIAIELDLEGQPATLSINPGTAGPNHFILAVPGDPLPDDTEAVVQVELIDGALGVSQIILDRTTGNEFEWHGSELSSTGDWALHVIVRSIGNFTWEGDTEATVEEASTSASTDPWRFTTHSIAALLLIGVGLAGLVIGWQASSAGLRKESMLLGAVAIILGLGIMATDRESPLPVPPRVAASDESIVEGQDVYQALCMSCHGATGQGDGPGASGLRPPPADFTDAGQHVHPDEEWFRAVASGVPGTAMPAFGEELTDEEIWHVINYIQREFQGM